MLTGSLCGGFYYFFPCTQKVDKVHQLRSKPEQKYQNISIILLPSNRAPFLQQYQCDSSITYWFRNIFMHFKTHVVSLSTGSVFWIPAQRSRATVAGSYGRAGGGFQQHDRADWLQSHLPELCPHCHHGSIQGTWSRHMSVHTILWPHLQSSSLTLLLSWTVRSRSPCAPWWCATAAVCGSCVCCRQSWKSTSAWHRPASKSQSASSSPTSQATTWISVCTRRSLIPERDRWGPKTDRWGTHPFSIWSPHLILSRWRASALYWMCSLSKGIEIEKWKAEF